MKLFGATTLIAVATAVNALTPGQLVELPHVVPAGKLSSFRLMGQFHGVDDASYGNYQTRYDVAFSDGGMARIKVKPLSPYSADISVEVRDTTARLGKQAKHCQLVAPDRIRCKRTYIGQFDGQYSVNLQKTSNTERWQFTFEGGSKEKGGHVTSLTNLEFGGEYFINAKGTAAVDYLDEARSCDDLTPFSVDFFTPADRASLGSYGDPEQTGECGCKMNFRWRGAGAPGMRPFVSMSFGK